MIYVTGDTHGNQGYGANHDMTDKLSSRKFKEGRDLTKDDFVIIAGDFGFLFANTYDGNPSKEEKYWLNWLDGRPWTTLFIDGNHENFDRLLALPEVPMFGSFVGKAGKSIFHLKRGRVYEIAGNTFFTFGGGESIDKSRRVTGVSWWPQEEPSTSEMMQGLRALKSVGFKVDYIITHSAPTSIAMQMDPDQLLTKYKPCSLSRYLDEIKEQAEFKQWFFGHFHDDEEFEGGKFRLLYREVKRIL